MRLQIGQAGGGLGEHGQTHGEGVAELGRGLDAGGGRVGVLKEDGQIGGGEQVGDRGEGLVVEQADGEPAAGLLSL